MIFYSGSNDDCSGHKMVGVINPAKGKNLRLWDDSTWNFTVQDQEDSRDDASPGTLYSRSCGDGDFILGAGQVVGIALGGAAAILIAGLLGFFCHRHSQAITGYSTPRFPVGDWDSKRMEQLIEEAEEAQCPKAIPRYSPTSFYPNSTPCKCPGGEEYESPGGQSHDTRRYENVSRSSMYEPLAV
ncbi:unnamed protein product [Clonostachys byssicola]|uniref:Uncharacterized protein n=1 Tax=Clonostachys byssicola TaxID=160290 RepID=A0A9N9UJU8_9HYPO|nr:unnamed protein product [Clonostachys byssicola]